MVPPSHPCSNLNDLNTLQWQVTTWEGSTRWQNRLKICHRSNNANILYKEKLSQLFVSFIIPTPYLYILLVAADMGMHSCNEKEHDYMLNLRLGVVLLMLLLMLFASYQSMECTFFLVCWLPKEELEEDKIDTYKVTSRSLCCCVENLNRGTDQCDRFSDQFLRINLTHKIWCWLDSFISFIKTYWIERS